MIDPSGGSRTGNALIDQYISGFSAGGGAVGQGGPGQQEQRSPFDKYRMYFLAPNPPITSLPQRRAGGRRPAGGRPGPNVPFWDPKRQQHQDKLKTQQDAVRTRDADRKRLESLAKQAGLIGDDFLPSELDSIWQQAIDEAEASSAMGKPMEPWEILQFWAKNPRAARNYAKPGGSAPDLDSLLPPEKKTVISKHTNTALTDPKTARAVVLAGLRSYLGRKPRPEEVRAFRSYLNDLERQNPTVSTTTSQYTDGQLDESSTVTEGGAPTPNAALETFVDDEYGDEAFAYRMAAEGDSLLRSIVGSIV